MIQGLLLAAGRSRRFGAPKLLTALPDGTPLGLAAAGNLRAALPDVLAVVADDDIALAELFRAAGLPTLLCADSRYGMGHSLAAGVAATGGATGWIIALADMPSIQPATIGRIATALAEGAILAAPSCNHRRGHPVGFSDALRDELLSCRGDVGARHIIAAHGSEMTLIDVPDPGIHLDIDEPAGLSVAWRSAR